MAVDPIKFLLDLDAKMGPWFKAKDITGKVLNLLVAIEAPLQRVARAWNAMGRIAARAGGMMGRGLRMMGRQVGSFAKDAMAHFTALAGFEGFKALIGGTVRMGVAIVNTVGQVQAMDRSLRVLLGPERAAGLQQFAEKVSKATGFDDDDLNKFSLGLVRVGAKLRQIPAMMAMATDLAQLTGGPPEEVFQSFFQIGDAFERLIQKGEIDARILRPLGVQEKDFMKQLAQRVGTDTDTLAKRLAAGKVEIDTILRQLQETIEGKTGKTTGGVAEEASTDLLMRLEKVKRIPSELYKTLSKSPSMTGLSEQLERLAQAFDPSTPTGKRISEGLEKMMSGFANVLKNLDVEKLSRTLTELFTKLPGLIEGTTGAALALLEVINKLTGKPGKAEPTKFASLEEEAAHRREQVAHAMHRGRAVSLPPRMVEETPEQKRSNAEFDRTIGRVLNWLPGSMGDARIKRADEVIKGLEQQVVPGAKQVGGKVSDAMNAAFVQAEQIRSPSRVWAYYGRMQAEGLAEGWEQSRGIVAGVQTPDLPVGGARMGGGPVSLSVPITVNWTGTGGDQEDAQALADKLRDLLPGHLEAVFAQLRMEAGG